MNNILKKKVEYIIAIGKDLIKYQKENSKNWLEHLKRQIDVILTQRDFLFDMDKYNPNKNNRVAYDHLTKLLVDLEHYKDMKKKIPEPDGPFNSRKYSIKGKCKNKVVWVDYTPKGTIIYEPLQRTFKNQIKKYDIINLVQEVLIALKIDELEVKKIIEKEFGKIIKNIEPKYKVIITQNCFLSLPKEVMKKETHYKVFIDYNEFREVQTQLDKKIIQIFDIENYKDFNEQFIKAPAPLSHEYVWEHLLNDFYDKLS